jgi:uncharacterized protein (DUF488 family)
MALIIPDIPRLYSVGHGTRSLEAFADLLQSFDITLVADIRTIPRSRHNPQYNRETLPEALAPLGIGYRHLPGLGGLRKPRRDSINTGWRNDSFRGFADYMQTDAFRDALEDLMGLAKEDTLVLMCAETLPWRCHRSLIADALMIRGLPVTHLLKVGLAEAHRLTSFARARGLVLTYPKMEDDG